MWWLLACTNPAPVDSGTTEGKDTQDSVDSGDSGDTDTPPDTGSPDTARGWLEYNHLAGGVVDGQWSPGRLGTIFYEAKTGRAACTVLGDWVETTEAPPECPDCDWSFTLTVVDTRLEGHCAALELQGAREGRWDGFTAPWGFATDWHDSAYGYTFSAVLFAWYDGFWFPWAYETGGGDGFEGDSTGFVSETLLDTYYL